MGLCSWLKSSTAAIAKPKSVNGVLVIIIGHGIGNDKGAWGVGPLNQYEWDYNMGQAKLMAAKAKAQGLTAVILNKHGTNTKDIGNTATHLVEQFGGKGCVIELHFNSADGKASGTECLYDTRERDNLKFAQICQKHMVALFQKPNRPLKDRTAAGRGKENLQSVYATGCLVEPLFGDNPGDAKLLHEKRDQYAQALVNAAMEYLQGLA